MSYLLRMTKRWRPPEWTCCEPACWRRGAPARGGWRCWRSPLPGSPPPGPLCTTPHLRRHASTNKTFVYKVLFEVVVVVVVVAAVVVVVAVVVVAVVVVAVVVVAVVVVTLVVAVVVVVVVAVVVVVVAAAAAAVVVVVVVVVVIIIIKQKVLYRILVGKINLCNSLKEII